MSARVAALDQKPGVPPVQGAPPSPIARIVLQRTSAQPLSQERILHRLRTRVHFEHYQTVMRRKDNGQEGPCNVGLPVRAARLPRAGRPR